MLRISIIMVVAVLGAGSAHAQVGTNQNLLNPNVAGNAELMALPHINTGLVEAIMDQRPFASVMELHGVLQPTLSDDQVEELFRRLFIPLNLNTASREEILMVPGVGNRMAHEFEEYREYVNLAQFRREMGKYVDDDEVARLEQYVFVPMDLNTASEDDFHTIPGMGNRMVHEFLEYRPYVSIQQFRREMGKYVDEDEVARLERYVKVN